MKYSVVVGLTILAAYIISDLEMLKFNETSSLPQGLYIRTFQSPNYGRVVAFRAPQRLIDKYPVLLHIDLLKPVTGLPGDVMCQTASGDFLINNIKISSTLDPAMSWMGCLTIPDNHVAVFSDLVPDSLDSRVFGAISIDGTKTYRLLWRMKI